jgi:hypothetical protein
VSPTRIRALLLATLPMLAMSAAGAVTVAPRGAAATLTLASPRSALLAPDSPQAQFRDHGSNLTLAVPAGSESPGYTAVVQTSPFQITTQRSGDTVLQTTAGVAGSSGPADFRTASGWATATTVQSSNWHDGVLDLTLATTITDDTVAYRITPGSDRYRMTWSVQGPAAATKVASHYVLASGRSLVRPRGGSDPGRGTPQPAAMAAGLRHGARYRHGAGVVPDDRPVLVHPAG